ncbi:unnamed protein product [Cochlearia groenlandica]
MSYSNCKKEDHKCSTCTNLRVIDPPKRPRGRPKKTQDIGMYCSDKEIKIISLKDKVLKLNNLKQHKEELLNLKLHKEELFNLKLHKQDLLKLNNLNNLKQHK